MFLTSLDGTRIAYDCSGAGPSVILLHGGGGSRQEWQAARYIQHLQDDFTVIALDLRGHGEWNGQPIGWDNCRWTGTLEKRSGQWVIVQMHFSFPKDINREL